MNEALPPAAFVEKLARATGIFDPSTIVDDDWYATEEAEEHARYDAQVSRADLTPIAPAPGTWLVESQWRKHADGYEPGPLRQACRDRADASRSGMSLACCAGAVYVRVASPDGVIRESWDREGNYWLTHDGSPSLLSPETGDWSPASDS